MIVLGEVGGTAEYEIIEAVKKRTDQKACDCMVYWNDCQPL